jgi:phosphonopyruvate decarboxylase
VAQVALTASRIVAELKKCGFDYVVTVPDDDSRRLYRLIEGRPEFKLVSACREGEVIAIAAGLMLGGKSPVVLIQNTGFYESGDSLRGLAIDLKLPMLLLISCRGWKSGNTPMTDSASIYLRPALDAWGIRHHLVEDDRHIDRISLALDEAKKVQKPVAILLGCEISDDE